MDMKKIASIMLILVLAVVFATTAYALPTVEKVKINGDVFEPGDVLVVQRGDNIDIRVKLSANTTENDVEVEAEILGYEHNDVESIFDRTPLFDMEAGDVLYKNLHLTLPVKMEKDYYDLRVRVGTRTGVAAEYLYRVRLTGDRHSLVIKDITFNPSEYVQSGRAVLAQVLVKNYGDETEEDVKVTLTIEGAGVTASDYIAEINPDESKETEDLFLRIPNCLESGNYKVKAVVEYNDGYKSAEYTEELRVVTDDEVCGINKEDKNVLRLLVGTPGNVKAGETVTVPVIVSNEDKDAKTVILDVAGVNEWGSVKANPSSVVVVPGESTAVVNLEVTPNNDAEGSKVLTITVSDVSGKALTQVAVPLTVEKTEQKTATSTETLKKWLEISLLVLVVLLILLGLIAVFSKMRRKEEGEETQTYY